MLDFLKGNRRDEEMIGKIVEIPIEYITPNPHKTRKYFSRAGLEKLSRSIKRYGILQPITVRETKEGYQLISGERRVRAAFIAGLSYVPAIIMNISDEKSAIFSLLENLQREELCFFEIAENYKRLLREQKIEQEELAEQLGRTKTEISIKLRLLKIPVRVRKMIRDYGLTERQAIAVSTLPSGDMMHSAVKTIISDKLSNGETERLIDKMIQIYDAKEHGADEKDLKFFETDIRKSVEVMQKKGISASMKETVKNDREIEYMITVRP